MAWRPHGYALLLRAMVISQAHPRRPAADAGYILPNKRQEIRSFSGKPEGSRAAGERKGEEGLLLD